MSTGTVLAALAALGLLTGALAQEGKAAKDIKEVMAAHKGKESLVAKITGGKGTDEDHKKILGLYEALATFKPPKGEEGSWKEKTTALVSAAKELVEKKEGAAAKLKAASNCKACHDVHKGK